MSWLFGIRKDQPLTEAPQLPTFQDGGVGAPGGGGKDGKNNGGAGAAGGVAGAGGYNNFSNFDPSGLERAAKAARELDKSGTCNCKHVTYVP